ncbi:MAG: thiamine phosphate synthase [Muribaculaceae bacterium]|nr:thiamine phosphate synthase [Muribaculaceae bacterium]
MTSRNHKIIVASDVKSAADSCRSSLEAGEEWIRLDLRGLDDAKSDKVAEEVVALCSASGAILTLVDDIERTERLKVHGIHLTDSDSDTLRAVRERLGANAIIGTDITSNDADEISRLRALDIDYFSFEGNDYLVE